MISFDFPAVAASSTGRSDAILPTLKTPSNFKAAGLISWLGSLRYARIRLLVAALIATLALANPMATARAGAVLDRVKAAGTLTCAVLNEPDDYDKFDIHGALDDLGDDICKAVAAAVLGDAGKVKSIDLSSEQRGFAALQAGKVDLLLGASPSFSAMVARGVAFGPPVFLDGEGFMVHKAAGIHAIADLSDKQVCYIGSTDADAALATLTLRRQVKAQPFPYEEDGEMQASLVVGHCDAVIDSMSRLAVARAGFQGKIKDFVFLPERLSVEPLAPAFQDHDPEWAIVVGAVVNALLLAEEGGITQANAAALRTTADLTLRPLGGLLPGIDAKIIDRDWAVRAITAVGNYAELYERDLGSHSPLDIPRGPNALWQNGGLLHATPPR